MDNPTPHDISQFIQIIKDLKGILIVNDPWIPLYSAIAGGLIATVPNALGALWKGWRARKGLEAAILAEISNIALVIRKRKLPEQVKANYADISEVNRQILSTRSDEDEPVNLQTWPLQLNVSEVHFKICEANLDKLGLLDKRKLPKIVHFYGLVESLIQDTKPTGGLGAVGSEKHYIEFIGLLEEALTLADELTKPRA